MTTEGWIGVMWDGVDGTAIDQVPKQGNQDVYRLLFFFYMFFCSLFVLNMFVGVTIAVFNTEKEKLHQNHYLTEL
jgi:hypothetical protein